MQLTRKDIIDKLKDILLSADERNKDLIEKVTEDSSLMGDLGFSSVGMLYMVIAIEESFKIRFDNVGSDNFKTIRDVVNFIEEKLK